MHAERIDARLQLHHVEPTLCHRLPKVAAESVVRGIKIGKGIRVKPLHDGERRITLLATVRYYDHKRHHSATWKTSWERHLRNTLSVARDSFDLFRAL